jgi:hypothetical protein
MMRRAFAVVSLLLSVASPASASCLPSDGGTPMAISNVGRFAASLHFSATPVKVGAPFAIAVRLCSPDSAKIERLVIDARMPAHRHGMNYKPEITLKGEGAYEARGFLFHMPGKWEIMLSVTDAASSKPQHFTLELDVR